MLQYAFDDLPGVTRTRRYAVLIHISALTSAVDPGTCCATGCSEPAQFQRVWLSTSKPGKIIRCNLNGARYCATHACQATCPEATPSFKCRDALAAYHHALVQRDRDCDAQASSARVRSGAEHR